METPLKTNLSIVLRLFVGELFGTNGVRGIFARDLTLNVIHDLVSSFASYVRKGPILVGHDGRRSSPLIARTVCATLNAHGLDCGGAGLVPTPCLELATKKLGYAGGIMVTASHNPPEYNGIKPCAADGVEISRDDEKIIERFYFNRTWDAYTEHFGKTFAEPKVVATYIESILSMMDVEKIRKKQFVVVMDLGNGAQAVTAPDFCKSLNCNVITINENIDGLFPGRGSEPTPENLSELSGAVRQNNADLGIAFDGDGDRSIFCDERGEIMTGDRSALLLARHILRNNPGSGAVTCMNSGTAIEEIAGQFDSPVIRTKVGSVEVSRKMIDTGAILGFEENGGFMYGRHNQVRDGAMTLGLMLDLMASSEKPVTDLLASLPVSHTAKNKIQCTPDQARRLIEYMNAEFPRSDTSDGIKITLGLREWVMIRPSGTEPLVRIYAEADSQERLDELIKEYTAKIKSII